MPYCRQGPPGEHLTVRQYACYQAQVATDPPLSDGWKLESDSGARSRSKTLIGPREVDGSAQSVLVGGYGLALLASTAARSRSAAPTGVFLQQHVSRRT